ncbi:MAG: NUDIX domain-containing protein [Gemmatimonadales bacterium]|nr:NUDIX domain-containing protein [Gemmatimonadales bacterium]
MTTIRVSLVDVYVLRGSGAALECLVLRRAPGGRCPGSWEAVHGHIEAEERPAHAALRELREETGLEAARFYNLSRIESFYQHRADELALVPVFVAMVAPDAEARLGIEHDGSEWLPVAEAIRRLAWPRERRALEDAVVLLAGGDAGALEDVLRVC